ncbi:hypothetical protein [Niveibacterium sp. SC-1]|uniref:hypothetical protein n=1 Tax=Niveibacterium sp. SC-1 TaxID=3135646 RepID=UPI00311E9C98
MIKEFAVQPEAIVGSYREFSYIIEKFGICEGRVISRFPKTWKRLVYEAAQARHRGTVEGRKIEERLGRLQGNALIAMSRPAGNGDWIDVALAEHQRQAFDYLLTSLAHGIAEAVPVDCFDAEHPCLQITREVSIARTAAEMAGACSFLLKTAREIKLVDPHLDFSHRRYREPFQAFMTHVGVGTQIDIFRGIRDDGITRAYLCQNADRFLSDVLPAGVRARIFLLPAETMHNRFLLTNLGGVKFGVGLDAAGDNAALEDELSLLVPDVWQARRAQYSNGELLGEWVGV